MSNLSLISSKLGPVLVAPLGRLGRTALLVVAYLGGLAVLLMTATRAVVRPAARTPGIWTLASAEMGWIFGMGLPLVALVHVALGSFLAMQSYYGGTFAEGTGAVVGVGLFRNVAAMMSGLTLAGLIGARVTAEHRTRFWNELSFTSPTSPSIPATEDNTRQTVTDIISFERRVAAQLIAATTAGPVLALWGTLVGTLVGWQVADGLMGVSTHTFFAMFWEMLWPQDVVSLVCKGMAFGLFSALLACHEGLRGTPRDGFVEVSRAACRAACFSAMAILVINSGWFLVFYHAGPAFGPTLLTPPAS